MAEARREGRVIQFASVHGITVEKAVELPESDLRRKHKGRAVRLGNRIWNQDYEQACFADLGSAPTLLEGGRSADAYGCLPGNDIEQADAVQAFIQARMRSEVWVSLPREAVQNPGWHYQVSDPVVPLDYALYGDPDSLTFWEMH